MAKRKSTTGKAGCNKWLYVVIPAVLALVLVFMALTCYDVDLGLGLHATSSLYDYLLDKNVLLAVGVCTLVINILAALYFLVILFVDDKTRGKLKLLTLFMLLAVAVANFVLALYTSIKLSWENIAFMGVVTYLLWFAVAGYACFLLVAALVKAAKK